MVPFSTHLQFNVGADLSANHTPCHEEEPGNCLQDTLETSLFAPSAGNEAGAVSPQAKKQWHNAVARLFPTDDGPANSYPTPLPSA